MSNDRPNLDAYAIQSENERAIKDLQDGADLPWWSLMELVLIGGGHPAELYDWITEQPLHNHGRVTVEKGGVFSGAGTLTFRVEGTMHGGMREVEDHVAQFSKKEVKWEGV